MAGKVYMTRTWEGKQIEERCPATMTSNEAGTHKAQPCNVFVFCPTKPSDGGLCWSNDVHNHTYGECWLEIPNPYPNPNPNPHANPNPNPNP